MFHGATLKVPTKSLAAVLNLQHPRIAFICAEEGPEALWNGVSSSMLLVAFLQEVWGWNFNPHRSG